MIIRLFNVANRFFTGLWSYLNQLLLDLGDPFRRNLLLQGDFARTKAIKDVVALEKFIGVAALKLIDFYMRHRILLVTVHIQDVFELHTEHLPQIIEAVMLEGVKLRSQENF